ncbi:oxygen-dependent tRNA uridine(34) hydroxylase TrhO [Roseivivax sp. CAU 1761]
MFRVAALYRFTRFDDPAALRPGLEAACRAGGVTGTLILAREGINGTIAGPAQGLDRAVAAIRALPGCAAIEVKYSEAEARPFARLKVRLKSEIVTMGQPGLDPERAAGTYVAPADWTKLVRAPDVAVIDTRNDYEVAIGSFKGAVDPGTRSFRDFPAWWEANGHRFANKKIAMFCTGGIRCEKSTAYLRAQGVEEVYHLKGGILKYLEEVPEAESAWQGECFVFDGRVSVGHGLVEGPHGLCHACRRPVAPADRDHPDYEEGVSCPACIGETDAADKARFRERQRQIALARARGERHLAADPDPQ